MNEYAAFCGYDVNGVDYFDGLRNVMKLILGNWKMNGRHQDVEQFLTQLSDHGAHLTQIGLAFPSPYLALTRAFSRLNCSFGAQSVSVFEHDGAFTGEVSAAMLADLGATWTLIGHSERRQYAKETGEVLVNQARAAYRAGLNVVFCVGEHLAERQSGGHFSCIEAQLSELVAVWAEEMPKEIVIAYEPIWAIGTGLTASLEEVEEMLSFVKRTTRAALKNINKEDACDSIRALYGGSVKKDNASALLKLDGLDGLLVGGASLKFDEFYAICLAR